MIDFIIHQLINTHSALHREHWQVYFSALQCLTVVHYTAKWYWVVQTNLYLTLEQTMHLGMTKRSCVFPHILRQWQDWWDLCVAWWSGFVVPYFFFFFCKFWKRHLLNKLLYILSVPVMKWLQCLALILLHLAVGMLNTPITVRVFKHTLWGLKFKLRMAGEKLIVILIILNGPLSSMVTIYSEREEVN